TPVTSVAGYARKEKFASSRRTRRTAECVSNVQTMSYTPEPDPLSGLRRKINIPPADRIDDLRNACPAAGGGFCLQQQQISVLPVREFADQCLTDLLRRGDILLGKADLSQPAEQRGPLQRGEGLRGLLAAFCPPAHACLSF